MNDEPYRLLFRGAWRDCDGVLTWTLDAWRKIADVPPRTLRDLQPLSVILWLQGHGYLPGCSEGAFQATDDGCSIVVTRISSGEPIYAIEYGDKS